MLDPASSGVQRISRFAFTARIIIRACSAPIHQIAENVGLVVSEGQGNFGYDTPRATRSPAPAMTIGIEPNPPQTARKIERAGQMAGPLALDGEPRPGQPCDPGFGMGSWTALRVPRNDHSRIALDPEGSIMAYADFTLDTVEPALRLSIRPGELSQDLGALPVPAWLAESLERGKKRAALVSEKARSEFIVVPILLAAGELISEDLTIFSGQRLDIDPVQGLVGECDFILSLTPPVPRLKAPLVTILEAKKGDIEAGLGPCIAQAFAARIFNERAGLSDRPVFGCVTSGNDWQFFRLDGPEVILDRKIWYLDQVGGILAMFRAIFLVGIAPNRDHP
jgi:hypothetical protein